MARTESHMLPLGTQAPSFTLPEPLSGEEHSLESLKGPKATLIFFICNHCPFVKHVNPELVQLAKDYREKGVRFIAVNSNDAKEYPEDSPEEMKTTARELGYPFPYLYDASQTVAKRYRAACTPDFYLFDAALELVYRGQLDDSRPENGKPLNGSDIRAALDALLTGRAVSNTQKPSVGCNIKWKAENPTR